MLPHFAATHSDPGPPQRSISNGGQSAPLGGFLFIFCQYLFLLHFASVRFPFLSTFACLNLITSSSRCERMDNVEHVRFMSITPSHPPFSGYCWSRVCVYVCVCQSLHARREHTGCHRASICQGDLVCQSWRTLTCTLPRPACCCLQR